MKTVAFRSKDSPRTTEYGKESSRKKGWKTVSRVGGARPKPFEDRQNASVSHVVMVSGTVRGTRVDPVALKKRTHA